MQKSYQKSVVVNHNDNGVDLMNSAYTNTNDLFKETLDLTKDLACKVEQANEKVMNAREQVVEEKEKGAMVKVDTYSNEKGRQANEQYRAYLEGSIAENFSTKTSLVEEKLALMEQISTLKMQMNEERVRTELELMKKKNETQIECDKLIAETNWELEKTKKEIADLKRPSRAQKFWNIACPFIGVAMGVLAYILMWVVL